MFGDYFFVFTLDMGILGAGLATAIGLYASNLLMLSHFFGKKNTLRFVKPTSVFLKIRNITVTGFSTAISDLAMGIIGILFNRQIMKYLGTDALAVYGILAQITPFAQCLAYGAGQAAQPIISQNLGAGQHDRIKECLKYGLYTCAGMGIFWTTVTQLAPNLFVNFFMAVAWGGICAHNMIALNVNSNRKTVVNIRKRGAFTVSVADVDHLKESDYFGTVSDNSVKDKFERS